MFLWHIHFFRFLQSSFETNQTFVENREKRLPETVNDSKVLPNLGRNLFEIEYLLLLVIKVPTYDLQVILFNVLLLSFMLDLLQIHKEQMLDKEIGVNKTVSDYSEWSMHDKGNKVGKLVCS